MSCPYPHCTKPLEALSSSYHEDCGRRIQRCTHCGGDNTVFNRFCTQCGEEIPEFSSWSEPLGNSLKNRSFAESFNPNVNFLVSWRKTLRTRFDVNSPEIVCTGDIVMIHNRETHSLEGYSLIDDNQGNPQPLESWQWNQLSDRACKAMSPVKADYYAIFADGTELNACFVIINLLTLESKRIAMGLDSELRRKSLPVIEKLDQENNNKYVLCYTLKDSLKFYSFSSKDGAIKLLNNVFFSDIYKKGEFWNPISLKGQIVHLTEGGAGITSRILRNDVSYSEFQITPEGKYFQPTVFINHVNPSNHNVHLFIPFQAADSSWHMFFSCFTDHWKSDLLVQKNLEREFEPSTFSCSGLNTISGSVFFHGDTFFRFSVRNNSLNVSTDCIHQFQNVKPRNVIAGAKNLLIAYDDSGCVFAFNLNNRKILNPKALCPNSNPRNLVSGPIFTDNLVILQNTREVICVKS
jgi:hypothetical protein